MQSTEAPKRYDVTDATTDEWLVRFGGAPFTLDRLSTLMDELRPGDKLTVTIMRQHDNAPA